MVIFVHGIDQAAFRFTRQGEHVSVAVGIEFEVAAAKGDFLILFLVVQRFQGNIGTRVTGIANSGINVERRFILRQVKQRFGDVVIHQHGMNGRHRRDQVKGLQLRQRQRTVAHHLIQHHALARFQPAVFSTGNRLHHQLHTAGKHAAMIILVAQLKARLRRAALNLSVSLRHHLSQTAFQLFPGKPGGTRPDHA